MISHLRADVANLRANLGGIAIATALLLACGPDISRAAGSGELIRVSGPSPFVQCTADRLSEQKGTAYVNAESEPFVAVNPRSVGRGQDNIIGVWQQDRWSNGSARGLVAGYSFDGGRTWRETPLPFSRCSTSVVTEDRVSDPWVSIGSDGKAYASGIFSGPRRNGIVTATSIDGGRTWSAPHAVLEESNTAGYDDKPSITADPARAGSAYLIWNRNRPGEHTPQPAWFSRTTDGGGSWSVPRPITHQSAPDTGTLDNQTLVDPRRHVIYDIFERFVRPVSIPTPCRVVGQTKKCSPSRTRGQLGRLVDTIAVIRSNDGGVSWTRPMNIAIDRGIGVRVDGVRFRTGWNIPMPTIDPNTGRLFVVWEDARFSHGRREGVAFTTSADGGLHWSAPRQIDADTTTPAFEPAIAVGRSGDIGITYYALGRAGVTRTTLPTNYWFVESADQGKHFSRPLHLAGPFNMNSAPNSGGLFLGDYQGLAADGSAFRPFFVATRSGNLSDRTDVFTAQVGPSSFR